MNTPTLKTCEECQGTGETIIEKHNCDCPDCLGTGLEQPQKRIMQLECELAKAREQIEANHKGVEMLERMVYEARTQRDAFAEALRKCVLWAECLSMRCERDRDNINWSYLNDARKTLAAVKGGSHE
jgi:RecJ-like exonuclease